jgi:mRNA-degrading endonuclease RelE of RelBE toxin-antitoxin system
VTEPQQPYKLDLSGSAARTLELKLPDAVASAVIEFISGPLLDNPHRAGKELVNELTGTRSARRGAFRILYEIDEDSRVVTVLRIGHRADVYRPG